MVGGLPVFAELGVEMRRWIATLLFIAAMGSCGVTAVSASAVPLEYGRCTKVATGTGAFSNAACTLTGSPLRYAWSQLSPTEPVAVRSEEVAGKGVFLYLVHWDITCRRAEPNEEGAYTGVGGLRGLVLRFGECMGSGDDGAGKVVNGPCTTPGQPAGVMATRPLEGEAGVVAVNAGRPDTDGLALIPEGGETFLEATCVGPVTFVLTGSQFSYPIIANKMIELQKLVFTSRHKHSFEGGPPHTMEGTANGEKFGRAEISNGALQLATKQGIEVRDCNPGC